MADHIPWAERLSSEVDAFFRLWRNRKWLAVIFLLIAGSACVISTIGWFQRGARIEELKADNRELTRDLRQLESENKGLRETVAPLLARAAKEFPGEEINASLKKLVDRMDAQLPGKKPILSATATVELNILTDNIRSGRHMGKGGYLAFGKKRNPLLVMSSGDCTTYSTASNQVTIHGVLTADVTQPVFGQPVSSLRDADVVQISFGLAPKGSTIMSGKATCTINNDIKFLFDIPPQLLSSDFVLIQNPRSAMESALGRE